MARVVSSSQASTRVWGSSAGVVASSTGRMRVRAWSWRLPSGFGPGAHGDQQLGVRRRCRACRSVCSASQPYTVRAAVVCPSCSAAWNSSTRGGGGLFGADGVVAEFGAGLLQFGEPVGPVSLVEGGGTVHDLQGEPQGRGQWTGARGEPVGGAAFGVGGQVPQQVAVARHRRRRGLRPRRARPAVLGPDGQGLIADRPHGAQLTGEAGDDAQQRQALHPQVVEPVPATQRQRGAPFRAGARAIVVREMGVAPAQAGQRFQFRFGGHLVGVCDGERGGVGRVCTELLGDGAQYREVHAGVRRPQLLGVAQVGLRGRTLTRRQVGEPGPATARDRPPRSVHRHRPARAAPARGPRSGAAGERTGAAGR